MDHRWGFWRLVSAWPDLSSPDTSCAARLDNTRIPSPGPPLGNNHRIPPQETDMPRQPEQEQEQEEKDISNARPEPMGRLEEQLIFRSRHILVFGEIDDRLAQAVCRRLLALSEESAAPITMLVSSPGGHVESGDAIHDMIRFVRSPVTTIGTGWVASAGAHVFLAPPKGRRVCLPNTRFMIHQPAGGAGGQASDIAIQAKEILRTRERIARVIARQTGRKVEQVLADMERDHWMNAEEAVAYGIVSRVIEQQKDLA
jgi:ATP-dependent Clp protease protease subunit